MRRQAFLSAKNKFKKLVLVALMIGFAGNGLLIQGQQARNSRLSVFLDLERWMDSDYIRQPWGSIRAGLIGFHHFHDFRSNRTEFSASLNLRIIEGLSLNLNSSYNLINDLVAIPKADMSLEEILLEQRRRTTSYEFRANIGLSYTFGSRITGVFNPRLDL